MEREARAGAAMPSLSGVRDQVSGKVFRGAGGGRFGDDSSMLGLLCTLFLPLWLQLHLRAAGSRPRRLGVPALEDSRFRARTKPLRCRTSGCGHLWGERPRRCLFRGSLCMVISALKRRVGGVSNITDLGVTSGPIPHPPHKDSWRQLEGHSEKHVSPAMCRF